MERKENLQQKTGLPSLGSTNPNPNQYLDAGRNSQVALPPKPHSVEAPRPKEGIVTSTMQMYKDFLSIVKNGVIAEIFSSIKKYNLDVTKVVDDNFRQTCLYYAALIKDPEVSFQVMKMFVDMGVSAVYTDIINQTVLYYVVREGKTNCVDYLLSLGCKINHRDQYGQTPLYYAAREGHIETAIKLLNCGADPLNEDNNGQTALFYSAREGRKDMCELLIKKGANPSKADKKRFTPIQIARKNNHQDVVNLLVSYGATLPKEQAAERERSAKKEAAVPKKKGNEKASMKKYVLTIYKDGILHQASSDEIIQLALQNPELNSLLKDPEYINKIKIPSVATPSAIYDHWDKAAKKILQTLWKRQGAWHFQQPVNPEKFHIPDYYQVVKKPMDLGTIKTRLNNCDYNTCNEFIEDMELVFNNCIKYNGESSDFGNLAKGFREEFTRLCKIHCFDFYL